MSLIPWLNQHPVFIEEVSFQVQNDMKGRPVDQSGQEGSQSGVITAFTLLLPLQLDCAECVGLTCAIPFMAYGLATGTAHVPDAEDVIFTRKGRVHGLVNVRFPEESWSPEAYLRMYPHIERIVQVRSMEFVED